MWDWGTFLHYIYSPYLLVGAAISLGISVASMAIGLALGLIAALMRMSPRWWIKQPASLYVWLFRGTPVLVQLIIIYTGLPQIGISLGVLASTLVGLGVNEGAYLAEIIRAGIASVPKGQFEAARAVGMTWPKTMQVVIFCAAGNRSAFEVATSKLTKSCLPPAALRRKRSGRSPIAPETRGRSRRSAARRGFITCAGR